MIDGIGLFRSMFKARGPSSDRFQEWYIGEVFVDAGAVVPNARRDGFEEDEDWKRLKRELEKWAKKLGDEVYVLSTKGQHSVPAQKRNLEKAKKEYRILQKAHFGDRDRTLTFLSSITKIQQRIAKGSASADLESLASFQAISAELMDLKTEALSQAGLGKHVIDIEAVQQDSRDALLKEVVVLLEDGLPPNCSSKAKELLMTLSSTGSSKRLHGNELSRASMSVARRHSVGAEFRSRRLPGDARSITQERDMMDMQLGRCMATRSRLRNTEAHRMSNGSALHVLAHRDYCSGVS